MQRGNWVPINKEFIDSLPTSRPYTELEAAFCITCDHDNKKEASISGYAKLWQWSRKRVANFAKKTGWSVSTTRAKRISLIDLDRTKTGRIVHDSTWNKGDKQGTSREQAGNKQGTSKTGTYNTEGTSRGQAGNKQGSSTIYPDPNPKNNTTQNGTEQGCQTETGTNHSKGRCERKKTDLDEFKDCKPDWWTDEQWEELVNHRRKTKGALTKRGASILINQFELARSNGETAESILNDLSENNWRGYQWEWVENKRIKESKHNSYNPYMGVK